MKFFYIAVLSLAACILLVFAFEPDVRMVSSCEHINFDDSSVYCVTIDTNCSQNNIWQIGNPQKVIFTSPMSPPNVIVTDTLNPYPPSDTSCFIITYIVGNSAIITTMSGFYRVNSDTLVDFCIMELSPDNGLTWIDVMNDTVYSSQIIWYSLKPVLTGNSGGWNSFFYDPSQLLGTFNVLAGDTLLWRFTFYSDSIQTNKDGIMFDDFQINSFVEGIDEEEYTRFASRVFPSPAKEAITINYSLHEKTPFHLIIFNSSGSKIMEKYYDSCPTRIHIESLPAGIYYYEIFNESDKIYSAGRFNKVS